MLLFLLGAQEKGESLDSPFFFIYEVSDLEFLLSNLIIKLV